MLNAGYVHNAGRETEDAFVGASSECPASEASALGMLAMDGRRVSGVAGLKLDAGWKTEDAFVGDSLDAGRKTKDAFVGGCSQATMVGRQASGVAGLKLNAGRKTEDAFVGGCSQATMVDRQVSGAEGLKLNAGRKTKDAFVRTRTASEQVIPLKSDVRPIANRHVRAGGITEGNVSPLTLFTTSRSIPQ